MTGWIQENSKKAASTLQKSVTDISTGMSEMMAENPAEKEASTGDGNEPEGTTEGVKVEKAQTEVVPNATNKNEVLNQVTAKFTNDVSKVWGSALSFGKDVYSKVESSEIVKSASEKVVEAAQSGAKLIEQAPILSDFNKEQEEFIKTNKKTGPIKPPWVGFKDEEQLKEQILQLSKDKRNFLRAPPAGAQFEFDYQLAQPVALAVLEHDPNLTEMRFQLVPKVTKEVDFWRNYFYRISLIKQSAEPLDEPEIETTEKVEINNETENFEEDFASEEVGTKSEDLPQWEKELQDELQNSELYSEEYEVVEEEESNGEWEKELEDMLGEAPEGQTETKEESKKD